MTRLKASERNKLLDEISLKKYEEAKQSEEVIKAREECSRLCKKSGKTIDFKELSEKSHKEISRLGGIARQEKRKKTLILADTLKMLMEMPLSDKDEIAMILKEKGIDDDSLTEATAICYTQIQRAKQDSKGFEVVRDTIGQKPIERQIIAEVEGDNHDIINRHFGDIE